MAADPDKLVNAILKVSKAFMLERVVYLIGASAAVLLVLYLAFTNLQGKFDQSLAWTFLGSGGLFATTGVGVLYSFNKTLSIIEKLLSQQGCGPSQMQWRPVSLSRATSPTTPLLSSTLRTMSGL